MVMFAAFCGLIGMVMRVFVRMAVLTVMMFVLRGVTVIAMMVGVLRGVPVFAVMMFVLALMTIIAMMVGVFRGVRCRLRFGGRARTRECETAEAGQEILHVGMSLAQSACR